MGLTDDGFSSFRVLLTAHLVRRVLILAGLLAGAFIGYALCAGAAQAASGTEVPVAPVPPLARVATGTVRQVAAPAGAVVTPVRDAVTQLPRTVTTVVS